MLTSSQADFLFFVFATCMTNRASGNICWSSDSHEKVVAGLVELGGVQEELSLVTWSLGKC